ncbi:MAG: SMP-30/gluconolactonase/LRE family protein [Pseudorhodobacter sp.]|nr:SMP-30/gluconolactonase/LRE family protein [Pseudorhodobacter sp.]
MMQVFDARRCGLGEGALWHPLRGQLFWFDIAGRRLLTQTPAGPAEWGFDEQVSAAGWTDHGHLLIASETALWRFALASGARQKLCGLDADNPVTRSNDGRADPQGGFWISTMGKAAEPGAGAIWRYFRGTLRCLYPGLGIPNAICFGPDGQYAHFCDTVTGKVLRVALDAEGWPCAAPTVFLDLTAEALHPDGAVVDAAGTLWLAQWGAGRVAAYGRDGGFLRAITVAAPHTSCPAFGGPDLTTLYCTTALQGMDAAARAAHPDAGKTFCAAAIARGQPEHQVIL